MSITQALQKLHIPWGHLKCQTTEQALLSSLIHLCGSFHGFQAGCHRQRPRDYPGLHLCSAGSRSAEWSSSPGCPSPLQCCNCHGIPEPGIGKQGHTGNIRMTFWLARNNASDKQLLYF